MKGTKIKIRVEFEESEVSSNSVTEPLKADDGSFLIELPESLEGDIDACEQALLRANFPAIRDAISQHLERVSKKNSSGQRGSDGPKRR